VLVRRLPYRNPSRLVSLYEDRSSTGFHRRQFTPANFADCKAQTAIFEDIAAIDADRFYNLAGNAGTPERLSAEGVTHNLFRFWGSSRRWVEFSYPRRIQRVLNTSCFSATGCG